VHTRTPHKGGITAPAYRNALHQQAQSKVTTVAMAVFLTQRFAIAISVLLHAGVVSVRSAGRINVGICPKQKQPGVDLSERMMGIRQGNNGLEGWSGFRQREHCRLKL
jgi:hypothetical protein